MTRRRHLEQFVSTRQGVEGFVEAPAAFEPDGWPAHRRGVSRTMPGLGYVGVPGQTGVASAMLRGVGQAMAAHTLGRLDRALRSMPHVHVLGAPLRPTPTLSFTVAGMRPRQVAAELARSGICAWDGDFYARELFDALGVNETGGAVRLGLLHYNTAGDVEHLIDSVAALQ